MLNLSSIMIGTENPKALAEFYAHVFGKPSDTMDGTDGKWFSWTVGNTYISVMEHSEAKGKAKEPARFMFNLDTNEVQKEFDRIKSLGATVIKEPYEMQGTWIATLADPDGNYFQLMTPWKGK